MRLKLTLVSTCVARILSGSRVFEDLAPVTCDFDAVDAFRAANPSRLTNSLTAKQNSTHYHLPRINNILRSAGYPLILCCGTLLGFARECSAIPGDRDSDGWMPRSFFPTKKHYDDLLQFIRDSGYNAFTTHGDYGQPGWQFVIQPFRNKQKVIMPEMYLDIFIVDEDFAIGGCQKAPCARTLHAGAGKLRRCTTAKTNFRLIFWLNTTFWSPWNISAHLVSQYGEKWTDPKGGVYKACYKNTPYEIVDKANPTDTFINNQKLPSPAEIVQRQLQLERRAMQAPERLSTWVSGNSWPDADLTVNLYIAKFILMVCCVMFLVLIRKSLCMRLLLRRVGWASRVNYNDELDDSPRSCQSIFAEGRLGN